MDGHKMYNFLFVIGLINEMRRLLDRSDHGHCRWPLHIVNNDFQNRHYVKKVSELHCYRADVQSNSKNLG